MQISNSEFMEEEIMDAEELAPAAKWRPHAKPSRSIVSAGLEGYFTITASSSSVDTSTKKPRVQIEREHVYGYRVR